MEKFLVLSLILLVVGSLFIEDADVLGRRRRRSTGTPLGRRITDSPSRRRIAEPASTRRNVFSASVRRSRGFPSTRRTTDGLDLLEANVADVMVKASAAAANLHLNSPVFN
ncbi:uncharacterized protein [Diadema setosum]|uniref:uncharacterized protein n=1 Tax=Diadema setosum TaxID=31175 RepID=UPI003B3AA3E7